MGLKFCGLKTMDMLVDTEILDFYCEKEESYLLNMLLGS